MNAPPRIALSTLYTHFDAIARGRDKYGDSGVAHAAILERLASNRRDAEAAGWTELALERDGGMGRIRLVGIAPGTAERAIVSDAPATRVD